MLLTIATAGHRPCCPSGWIAGEAGWTRSARCHRFCAPAQRCTLCLENKMPLSRRCIQHDCRSNQTNQYVRTDGVQAWYDGQEKTYAKVMLKKYSASQPFHGQIAVKLGGKRNKTSVSSLMASPTNRTTTLVNEAGEVFE